MGIIRKDIVITYWRENEKFINFGENIPSVLIRKFGYNVIELYKTLRVNKFLAGLIAKTLGKGKLYNKLKEKKYHGDCLLAVSTFLNQYLLGSEAERILVWGDGAGYGPPLDSTVQKVKDKVRFFAVRGPLTKKALNLNETIPCGDPGFLLPIFFPIKRLVTAKSPIIFMPHHSNRDNIAYKLKILGADKYVDVMGARRSFWGKVKDIIKAKFVLTNSLHTAIVSHAYHVPWALSMLPGEHFHSAFKWKDVLGYLGITIDKSSPNYDADLGLNVVKNYEDGLRWYNEFGIKGRIPDRLPLIKAFPYPIIGTDARKKIREMCNSYET